MRHLRSILYALVLAPTVWILCGAGFTRELTVRAAGATGGADTVTALLLLVLAGAAYAILVSAPISPLGPALAGLAFLGVAGWAQVAPGSYAGLWPAGVAGERFDLGLPGHALAALLAVPLLCTALSVRRWAGSEPPVLPLIGRLGRAPAPGAPVAAPGTPVAAPGTPVAAERPAVLLTADPTVVLPTAAGAGPVVTDGGEQTQRVGATDDLTDPDTGERTRPVGAVDAGTDTGERTRPVGAVDAGTDDAGTDDDGTDDDGTDDDGERTQILRPPADLDGPTHPIAPDAVTRARNAGQAADDRTARDQAADDQTARDQAAQERSRQAFRDRAAQERSRNAFDDRAARAARETGEKTQRIAGPGERAAEARSIADRERPDPGADPTTRLVPAQRRGTDPVDDAAADGAARPRSVLDQERPADEAADDTRRLPGRRRPAEAEEPAERP